jgi:polysaccharide biosynthesis/export protein
MFFWKASMRIISKIIKLSLTVAIFALPLFAQATPSKDDRYRIGFQDVLDIQVFRHPELNLRTSVNPNGMIYLYRLEKPLAVVCKTEREVANDIAAAYKAGYLRDPQVNVLVAEQKSQSLAVIGAVEKPGSFFISRKVHLLELLAMAGGPNKEAGTRILVARTGSSSNCRTEESGAIPGDDIALMGFKIRDVQEGKKTLWMQPGDVVSVLAEDIVYVYGNVNRQGEIKVREPITLRQAIASAEGLKSATRMDRVRILRQKPDSMDRDELVYNLKDIDKGTARDPYLEPNDIVAVSLDSTKSIIMSIGNALKYSIPTAVTRIPIP